MIKRAASAKRQVAIARSFDVSPSGKTRNEISRAVSTIERLALRMGNQLIASPLRISVSASDHHAG